MVIHGVRTSGSKTSSRRDLPERFVTLVTCKYGVHSAARMVWVCAIQRAIAIAWVSVTTTYRRMNAITFNNNVLSTTPVGVVVEFDHGISVASIIASSLISSSDALPV